MTITEIKQGLRVLHKAKDHDEMLSLLPECWKVADGCSPLYNHLTAHKQYILLRSLKIGEKDLLYVRTITLLTDGRYGHPGIPYGNKYQIITWIGTKVSRRVDANKPYSCGICRKRINITFWLYNEHKFTGIYSPNSGNYITVKRVK